MGISSCVGNPRCWLRSSVDISQAGLDLATDIAVINPRMNIHVDFEVDGSLKEVRELYYVKLFSVILFGDTF